jgi:hypothetical protein
LIADGDTHFGCALDHIVSEKHGGLTEAANLALACVFCNQAKGSDIGSNLGKDEPFVRFFNPRMDVWAEHFTLDENRIKGISPIGEVTARILRFNAPDRVLERQTLLDLKRFPCGAGRKHVQR